VESRNWLGGGWRRGLGVNRSGNINPVVLSSIELTNRSKLKMWKLHPIHLLHYYDLLDEVYGKTIATGSGVSHLPSISSHNLPVVSPTSNFT
jgi:hypothetical protein